MSQQAIMQSVLHSTELLPVMKCRMVLVLEIEKQVTACSK